MDYNSMNHFDASELRSLLLRTLALETPMSFYKTLYDLNEHNDANQIIDADKLEQILKDFGYAYDPQQNIFYSRADAWQRKYGYCWLYDELAAPFSIIMDCEPVHFEYDNRKWLIELWKGQYGITSGGELGVFTSVGPDLNIPGMSKGIFYRSVDDEDCLHMSFELKKSDRVLFKRSGLQWWLTGFVLGEFSEPSELIMDATITLKDREMCKAFTDALIRLGYSEHELCVTDTTVALTFAEPHSKQPFTRTELITKFSQKKNEILCRQYQNIAKASLSMYEILKALANKYPVLFAQLLMMGRPAQLLQAYETIIKYLGTPDL